ncbi:hypothetical protein [Alkalihalobacillus sp. LMS39]|uniref:hypothetical protein n=1 Tax=Alkalihalobacillus sp. LMS39 TaxID=2924032 RepID=UPI001FB39638|nr:hypothetical protein [Alkalihalobacillus sp. LMS39]UOE95791.1 hypothetical protein MM271_09395 [Alkalihalobacillus sp. LMS39]
MKKKYILLFILLGIGVVVINFMDIEKVDNRDYDKTNEEHLAKIKELEKELRDVKLEHINVTEELKAEISALSSNMFKLSSIILDSDKAHEVVFGSEILYKEITDSQYVVIANDEFNTFISVVTRDKAHGSELYDTKDNEFVNWSGSVGIFAGYIWDDRVTTILVEDESIHTAEIIQLPDGTQIWYVSYEPSQNVQEGDLVKINIKALDRNDEMLFEESFDSFMWDY